MELVQKKNAHGRAIIKKKGTGSDWGRAKKVISITCKYDRGF